MSEMIVADGRLYEVVWPYREHEPPPERPMVRHKDAETVHYAKGSGLTRTQRVIAAIAAGARTRGELARSLHMSNGHLRQALNELLARGRIRQEVLPPSHGTHGQSTYAYRLASSRLAPKDDL